ncbi:MAG: hypothetical protein HC853_10510 [Anaerolineae bacterium]|nr:hypothetical protein [Anaerolineae bacterium]
MPGFNSVWDEWTEDWREPIERNYVVKGLALVDRLIHAKRWQDATYWCSQLLSVQHSADSTDAAWHKLLGALSGMMESWQAHMPVPAPQETERTVILFDQPTRPKTHWVLPPDFRRYTAMMYPWGCCRCMRIEATPEVKALCGHFEGAGTTSCSTDTASACAQLRNESRRA